MTHICVMLNCQVLGAFNKCIQVTTSAIESEEFLACKQLLMSNAFQSSTVLLISNTWRRLPVFDTYRQDLKDTTTSHHRDSYRQQQQQRDEMFSCYFKPVFTVMSLSQVTALLLAESSCRRPQVW